MCRISVCIAGGYVLDKLKQPNIVVPDLKDFKVDYEWLIKLVMKCSWL